MNLNSPLFSVIIPTFNREQFLNIVLKSVLDQSFDDFELIIIDDGSTDQTEEIVKSFKDQRIVYQFQDNHGVAHARNQGLQVAKGRYIAFLDSDDKWVSQKLERVKNHIDQFPEFKIFHTEEIWYRGDELLNQKKKHKKPNGRVYQNALSLCCISISTAVISREVFDDVGTFDERLAACEDYDFWLRATHKYDVKLIEEYLTIKDGGRPDQLSSQWGLDQYRIQSLAKMLASKQLNQEDYQLTYQELVKKCRIFASGARKRGREEQAKSLERLIEKYAISSNV